MKERATRIIFFIGSLRVGGKERRMLELLTYLKSKGNFDILILLTKDKIHYTNFLTLGIPYRVIHRRFRMDYISVFLNVFQICKEFKPDLIHTWGRIQSVYTLPAVIYLKAPLVNSQITSAPPTVKKLDPAYVLDKIIYKFSRIIIANSFAGISSFKPPLHKSKVIYNGLNFSRFLNLHPRDVIKSRYKIHTPYTVVMTANFSPNKDYDYFFSLAELITRQRTDITFIGIGHFSKHDPQYIRFAKVIESNSRIILTGRIKNVEELVNACDIGVLFSPNGEGLSNAILEYMALGKPVVASDTGGNKEIVKNNENGYLIRNHSIEYTANLILGLIDDKARCDAYGEKSKNIITEAFSLDKMGNAFVNVYNEILSTNSVDKYDTADEVII